LLEVEKDRDAMASSRKTVSAKKTVKK